MKTATSGPIGDAPPTVLVSTISAFHEVIAPGGLTTSLGHVADLSTLFTNDYIQPYPLSGRDGSSGLIALKYPTTLVTVTTDLTLNFFSATVTDPYAWAKDPTPQVFMPLVTGTSKVADVKITVAPSTDQVVGDYRYAFLDLSERFDLAGGNLIIPVCKTAIDGTVGGGDVKADELAKSALMMKVL